MGKAIDAEAFDERMAILEFDGELPHDESERRGGVTDAEEP